MKRKAESPAPASSKKTKTLETELLSSSQLVGCLLPEILSDLTSRLGETQARILWGAETHRPPYWPEELLAWSLARDPRCEGSNVTEEILRECLNNYLEWRLDRQEEEEEKEREQRLVEQVMMNPVLQDEIFPHLQPSDLKAVALVCRAWNSAVEQPRYWRWAGLTLQPRNLRKIFQNGSRPQRFRNLGRIALETGFSHREVMSVLSVQSESRWRSVMYRGTNLSTVPATLLTQALTATSVRELELCANSLSADQLQEILERISEGPQPSLRRLKISQTSLESVSAGLLARALVRLEEVEVDARVKVARQKDRGSYSVHYDGLIIDDEQTRALFQEIERSAALSLRKLTLNGLNLAEVSPSVLSRALLSLREVRLERCHFSDDQADSLLRGIAHSKPQELALKTLIICRSWIIVNPPLLKKIREKIDFQIIADIVEID